MKAAIIGHSPDTFSNVNSVLYNIENILVSMKNQHKEDFVALLAAEIGVGQWAADVCLNNNIIYELYLAGLPEYIGTDWFEEQQNNFLNHLSHAKQSFIDGSTNILHERLERNKRMIDKAQSVIVFWDGRKYGLTYESVKYAIQMNKIIYNGLGEFKLIDNTII